MDTCLLGGGIFIKADIKGEMNSLDVERQFDTLRHNLLDLTMKNSLLNFHPAKRTIKVIDEIPAEIYDILVLKEKIKDKEMEFLPIPEQEEKIIKELRQDLENALKGHFTSKLANIEILGKDELSPEEIEFINALIKNEINAKDDELSEIWDMPGLDLNVENRHKDLYLQTKLNSKELQKRLFYINQKSNTAMEEQGYNILYLALGFLKWNEIEESDFKKAPLILIPVELDRKKVKGSFKLRWNGEDIITNISLQSKLKEQGIELPEFEMPESKEGIYKYLNEIQKAVSLKEEWKVVSEIFLGFFSFTKFVMYKDLDKENWPINFSIAESPIIKEIFSPSGEIFDNGFEETSVDELLTPKDTYNVVDADSSQIAVIEDVKNGRNMVVEGPPGTGKSQTIVNLIAELIAKGNTVLFVSAKMAALEVVKSRLDNIGLGEFCLELHSEKSKKKEILNQLEATITNTKNIQISLDDEFDKFGQLRTELNEYVQVLHKPYGATGFTPFHLFGLKEKSMQHFNGSGQNMPRFEYSTTQNHSIKTYNKLKSKLKEISELLNLVSPLSNNPWNDTKPDLILPSDQEEIGLLMDNSIKNLDNLKSNIIYLNNVSGTIIPDSLNDLDDVLNASKLIADSMPIEKEILSDSRWDTESDDACKLIGDVEDFNSLISSFNVEALEEDIETLIKDYETFSSDLFNISTDLVDLKEQNIKMSLNEVINSFKGLKLKINNIINIAGLIVPDTLNDLNDTLNAAELVANFKPIEKEILLNFRWDTESDDVYKLIKSIGDFNSLMFSFKVEALDEDIETLIKDYETFSSDLFKIPSDLVNLKEQNIKEAVKGSLSSWTGMKLKLEALMSISGINIPESWNDLEDTLDAAQLIANSVPIEKEVLLNSKWDTKNNEAYGLIENLIEFNTYYERLSKRINPNILDQDIKYLINEYERLSSKFLKFLSGDFKKIKNKIASFYKNGIPTNNETVIHDLRECLKCQEIKDILAKNELIGLKFYGSYWKGEKSDISLLTELSKWIIQFRKFLTEGKLSNDSLNIINSEVNSKKINETLLEISEYKKDFIIYFSKMVEYVNVKYLNKISLIELDHQLNSRNQDINNYFEIKSLIKSFYVSKYSITGEKTINDLKTILKAKKLREQIRNDKRGKEFFGSYWNAEKSDLKLLKGLVESILAFREQLNNVMTEEAAVIIDTGAPNKEINELISDISQNLSDFLTLFNKLNEYLNYEQNIKNIKISGINESFINIETRLNYYFKLKEYIYSFYNQKVQLTDEAIISDLEKLVKGQEIRESIRNNEKNGKEFFGSYWDAEKSDTVLLNILTNWIIEFRELFLKNTFENQSIDIVASGANDEEINDTISEISKLNKELFENKEKLDKYLHFDNHDEFNDSYIEDIKDKMNFYKSNIGLLPNWSQFISLRNEVLKTEAKNIIELIESDSLKSEDVIPCFEGNFADSLLKNIFKLPTLTRFNGDIHENKINEFRVFDKELIKSNKMRIIKNLYDYRPPIQISASPKSELGRLKSEFSRKRRHMPIRKLLFYAGNLIKKIKPCFMMSPLSVAQYLDPQAIKNLSFDYVIFDEASQVKPEDALGSLLRAKKAVIMGDTKQLPPTSFFDALVDKDEDMDYESDAVKDMESILHLCKRSFPTKMLRWHYRSRHESLIAVSNQEFYGNDLLIYPSPSHESKKLGLKFNYLPDTVYDRGRSTTNREEAKAVIKAAFEHYQKYGNSKSLGIATFNIKQQNAILEELERQLRLNPKMEKFFSKTHIEPFFVKNLETIQGDERDVIFISIGYGFDSNRKLHLNFGPLNNKGGERRLNVLVTRAKEKCVVFSNFRSSDIPIKPNASVGLRALKVFLEYAETGSLKSVHTHGQDTESPFEDAVCKFLQDEGYLVHKQVGCAGFRIDLAIVDSDNHGEYLLGIECDGAMYHSSPVARDRDRLRQQVLEGLGWKIHRIWSTDWYRNREGNQKKLLDAIKRAKNNDVDEKVQNSISSPENKKFFKKIRSSRRVKPQSIEDKVFDYKTYTNYRLDTTRKLQELPIVRLANMVTNIVKVEGPVHVDEVKRRIRVVWNLKRTGPKIQKNMDNAIKHARLSITQKGDFLYYHGNDILVRRRNGDPPANISLICKDEIAKAVKLVIEYQFSIPQEELVRQVAKVFGIKVVRESTAERIDAVVKGLIDRGELEKMSNEMINFPQ